MALIDWRQSTDIMSDWVVESLQEIVSELKKEQRRLFLCRCLRREPGNLNAESDLQATSCSKMSGTGFRLQTRGRTMTSRTNLDIVEAEHGGFKVILMRNGSLLAQIHSYGSTENVSILRYILS